MLPLPEGKILLAATEDLIADRLGQWVASNRRDDELFQQARMLFALAESPDPDYLETRIRQDTAGMLTLAEFRALGLQADHP